ncbi:MAG: YbaK/EbsC family protein [Anaerolineae bacterium]|nr:YbaK/EbsC family protein [Anaerolineae bacterium]
MITEIAQRILNILEEKQIPHKILPHDEPVFTIETAARQRDVVAETMVKSILLRESRHQAPRYVMGCVPGHLQVHPQAVRAALPSEWRRLTFASKEEITAVTTYIMGAVSPLCLPPEVPVIFDEAFTQLTAVSISSGDPGFGIELAASDLIRLVNPLIAPITH